VIADKGLDDWVFAQGELLVPPNPSRASATLTRLAAALRGRGILPVLVVVPPRLAVAEDKLDPQRSAFQAYRPGTMAAAYREVVATLRAAGWSVPDLVEIAGESRLGADFFNGQDHHWSTRGAQATAEAIAVLLQRSPGWSSVARAGFDLEERRVANPGTYRFLVVDKCRTSVPSKETTSYKAVPRAAVSASALLGDGPAPDVVLVGTSQSRRQDFDALTRKDYFEDSFAALLRASMGADLLNLAAEGGGTFTSIESWLTSPEFQQGRPRVLIWEMNQTDGFDQPELLRRLVPAVHGTCRTADALAAQTGDAADGIDLAAATSLALAGSRIYLSVRLSDATVRGFDVTFTHAQVRKETVRVERSALLPNSGLFFVELNPAITLPLSRVQVELPGARGTVEARLCAAP
jgi:hypothetical protein